MRLKALGLVTVVLYLAGCGGSTTSTSTQSKNNQSSATATPTYTPDAKTLNIVAGSEQQTVLDDVVVPWCKQHGYTCNYTLLGSVDQARLLQSGQAPYDAFWFASSVFEELGDTSGALRDVQPMFITPIVFAGWKSEMQRLGLVGASPTIADLVKLVESHRTTVWTTNPTQSNSGATMFLEFLNYFAGNPPSSQLTLEQLNTPQVESGIKTFIRGFAQTPPSTGTMMTECLQRPDACKTMFTYEDLVIQDNQQLVATGKQPLYVVYPKDGLAISDAPLGFLPHGNDPGKEQTFMALQHYLLSTAAQAKLEALGRRPITSIGLSLPGADPSVFNPAWGVQADVSAPIIHYPTAAVIQAALDNYQLSYRVPVSAYYCLDSSGSMDSIADGGDGGWAGVSQAANLLFNPVQASQYLLQINPKDRTTVDVFDQSLKDRWTVTGNNPQQLLQLRNDIDNVQVGGSTGIFRCLARAAAYFQAEGNDGLKRLVILMTDGQDNQGGNDDGLVALHVPVIAIGFSSQADLQTLQSVASQTGGAEYSATDLVQALRNATGYK